jgi:hypothetical protein
LRDAGWVETRAARAARLSKSSSLVLTQNNFVCKLHHPATTRAASGLRAQVEQGQLVLLIATVMLPFAYGCVAGSTAISPCPALTLSAKFKHEFLPFSSQSGTCLVEWFETNIPSLRCTRSKLISLIFRYSKSFVVIFCYNRPFPCNTVDMLLKFVIESYSCEN